MTTDQRYLSAWLNAQSNGDKTRAILIAEELSALKRDEETQRNAQQQKERLVKVAQVVAQAISFNAPANQSAYCLKATHKLIESRDERSELLRIVSERNDMTSREIKAANNFVEQKLAMGALQPQDMKLLHMRLQKLITQLEA